MGKLIRAISADGGVVCYCADTTDIASKAEQIHTTSAVVTAALGRLLTAASLIGVTLKGEKPSITLRLAGDGPASPVIAVADSQGNVRGYVGKPVVELPLNQYGKLDVAGAVGRQGTLSIVKDLGFGDPYIGQVPLVSGEIAEDITSYFATSEQIPTVCALGVLVNPDLTVKAAGGYLIQLLPGADDNTIDRLEANMEAMAPVSTLIAQGLTPTQVMEKALAGFEPQIIEEAQVEYRCDCSRQRVERALISVGKADLLQMAQEQETSEVSCHFCNKVYAFTAAEIKKLANS